MEILVTGGTGYIGSHTCVELINAGYKVIVADNLSNSNKEVINRIKMITNNDVKFYKVDILNKKDLNNIFAENNIEAVIHFAGLKAVEESVNIPIKYYYNNITGTLKLCEVMQSFNVKKMVFSSSATVYGYTKDVPIKEDAPLNATNPYGRTKLMIEEILIDLHNSDKDWSISLLRYFNPIGAHESGLIGEGPNGIPNNLMPFITQVALGKINKLNIFGNDYNTHDGTCIRDYIHVVDLAKGHLSALKMILSKNGIDSYNLGTGVGYSVLEVIYNFEEATGRKIPYNIIDRRPGDVAKSYADTNKAFELLGWRAEKNLMEMCKDAWRWQTANPNGYR